MSFPALEKRSRGSRHRARRLPSRPRRGVKARGQGRTSRQRQPVRRLRAVRAPGEGTDGCRPSDGRSPPVSVLPSASAQAVAFLRDLGAAELVHPGGSLLAHLHRVQEQLAAWGARPRPSGSPVSRVLRHRRLPHHAAVSGPPCRNSRR
ncbi:DUF6817 domain-containing protein [Streptomyces montanus]|uniref:DUF6817 domain-containing protein n=1 Tax=Streptomyces montanus TaxID=2580423 RepID=UPI003CCC7FD6